MKRSNHYELAVEAYLRACQTPYVAVDESRRAILANASLKSLDFIAYAGNGPNLLIDVKGRKFSSGSSLSAVGENWVTADDLASLREWSRIFGSGFRGLFLFAYDLSEAAALGIANHPPALAAPFRFRQRDYLFWGVWLEDYAEAVQIRSPRWETCWVPAGRYRTLRFPLADLLRPSSP